MIESTPINQDKQKNSYLSIGLITVNLVLALFLSVTMRSSGDEFGTTSLAYVLPTATILIGAFALTYHGKGYGWAKWLFGVCIIVTAIFFGLLFYAWGLGKAFQH
mgnify:CR=1 FL=1